MNQHPVIPTCWPVCAFPCLTDGFFPRGCPPYTCYVSSRFSYHPKTVGGGGETRERRRVSHALSGSVILLCLNNPTPHDTLGDLFSSHQCTSLTLLLLLLSFSFDSPTQKIHMYIHTRNLSQALFFPLVHARIYRASSQAARLT